MKSDKFELIYKKSIKLYSLYFKHDLKLDNYISSLYTKNNNCQNSIANAFINERWMKKGLIKWH